MVEKSSETRGPEPKRDLSKSKRKGVSAKGKKEKLAKSRLIKITSNSKRLTAIRRKGKEGVAEKEVSKVQGGSEREKGSRPRCQGQRQKVQGGKQRLKKRLEGSRREEAPDSLKEKANRG